MSEEQGKEDMILARAQGVILFSPNDSIHGCIDIAQCLNPDRELLNLNRIDFTCYYCLSLRFLIIFSVKAFFLAANTMF